MSYNAVPPPSGSAGSSQSAMFEEALRKAKEVAARLTGAAAPPSAPTSASGDNFKKRQYDEAGNDSGNEAYSSSGHSADTKRVQLTSEDGYSSTYARAGLGATTSESYPIPSNHVGLIIGKGGETIRRLEAQSGCKINCPRDTGAPERVLSISGSPEAIEHLKTLIKDLLGAKSAPTTNYSATLNAAWASGANTTPLQEPAYNPRNGAFPPPPTSGGDSSAQGSPYYQSSQQPQSYQYGEGGAPFGGQGSAPQTEIMMIPSAKVGLVIGRGGDKIREIESRSGARLQMIQFGLEPGVPEKPLHISGDPAVIEVAKRLVEDALNSGRGGAMGGGGAIGGGGGVGGTTLEILVPGDLIGFLIGDKGETIKRVQYETGARAQFRHQDQEPTPGIRTLVISGDEDAVRRAENTFKDMIEEGKARGGGRGDRGDRGGDRGYGGSHSDILTVPSQVVGSLIGKAGEGVKQIQQATGARISLNKDTPQEAPEKFFNISGEPAAVARAIEMMRERVDRLLNGQYPAKQQYGRGDGYGGGSAGAGASGYGAADTAAAGAYGGYDYSQGYAQYAQQYSQYAQQYPGYGAGYDWSAYYAQQGYWDPNQAAAAAAGAAAGGQAASATSAAPSDGQQQAPAVEGKGESSDAGKK